MLSGKLKYSRVLNALYCRHVLEKKIVVSLQNSKCLPLQIFSLHCFLPLAHSSLVCAPVIDITFKLSVCHP